MCGGPTLPDCPLFWENGSLSTKGKIAIGLSSLVFFCVLLLVIYMFCIRRGRNDYDFGLPQDLMCKYDEKEGQIHQSFSMFFSFALFYLSGDTVVYHFIICRHYLCFLFVLLKWRIRIFRVYFTIWHKLEFRIPSSSLVLD